MRKPILFLTCLLCFGRIFSARAQDGVTYHGDPVTPELESTYQKGLRFLLATQSENGSWTGNRGSEAGVVGLAVLAVLAHGEDPNEGPYSAIVRRGLEYILNAASPDTGYIGSSMYNHAFATLALAESYGVVEDPRIGLALKKAVDLILSVQARNPQGAWRYNPSSTDADSTVAGSQMVALYAARNAGLGVPDSAIKKGLDFYRKMRGGDGGFGYSEPGSSSPERAAVGALVFALAREKDSIEFRGAMRYLRQQTGMNCSYPYYYVYYASQAFFHASQEDWREWNARNIKSLSAKQAGDGSWQGNNGPAFSTSAALLSLALNYRFLPIYER